MKDKIQKYKYKLIDNGKSIEVYQYHEPKYMKSSDTENIESRTPAGRKRGQRYYVLNDETKISTYASLEDKLNSGIIDVDKFNENRQKNIKDSTTRAITTFRRLFESNVNHIDYKEKSKFITLTFAEDITERAEAVIKFKDFIKRLNYYVARKKGLKGNELKKQHLKWLAVMELQVERGNVWHFHIAMFNLPFTHFEDFKKIWTDGAFHLQIIGKKEEETEHRKVVFYMVKYMMKETLLDVPEMIATGLTTRQKGIKNYLSSRGLKKPKKILLTANEEQELEKYFDKDNLAYESTFYNDFTGQVSYSHYSKD